MMFDFTQIFSKPIRIIAKNFPGPNSLYAITEFPCRN